MYFSFILCILCLCRYACSYIHTYMYTTSPCVFYLCYMHTNTHVLYVFHARTRKKCVCQYFYTHIHTYCISTHIYIRIVFYCHLHTYRCIYIHIDYRSWGRGVRRYVHTNERWPLRYESDASRRAHKVRLHIYLCTFSYMAVYILIKAYRSCLMFMACT